MSAAETPAGTVRRGADRLSGRATAATARDRAWMTPTAESWRHIADEMDDYKAREERGAMPDGDAIMVCDFVTGINQGYRLDWTATLAAARAILGEAA